PKVPKPVNTVESYPLLQKNEELVEVLNSKCHWMCHMCRTVNTFRIQKCKHCDSPYEDLIGLLTMKTDYESFVIGTTWTIGWNCEECQASNLLSTSTCTGCGICDTEMLSLQHYFWQCTTCTTTNKESDNICIACARSRNNTMPIDINQGVVKKELE